MFPWFSRPPADEVLDALQESLCETCGENLLSLTLYGEHVDKMESRRPLRVLLVFQSLDLPLLNSLSQVFARAWWRPRVSPMILSLHELQASTDVFPVTFGDMRRRYRVLCGEDVLNGLEIRRDHLRLRCEQELKNLLLRMQRAFLLHSARPRRLRPILLASFATYQKSTRAVLSLVDPIEPASEEELLSKAAAAWSLDPVVLERLAAACQGRALLAPDAIRALFGEFLYVVHRTAAAVDQLPDDEPAPVRSQEESP